MADDVTIHNGASGTGTSFDAATDDDGSGNHIQLMKQTYSANGVRTPIPADADGLLVNLGANNDVSVNAGTNVIGKVRLVDADGDEISVVAGVLQTSGAGGGSSTDKHTGSATSSGLSTGSTYAALDQMGDLEELTSMAAASGGDGVITTCRLYCDTPGVLGGVRLWFFSGSVTLAADNAAFALSDSDGLKVEGYLDVPAAVTTTNGTFSQLLDCNLDYTCDATSLFVAFQTLTATTVNFGAVGVLHLEVDAYRL